MDVAKNVIFSYRFPIVGQTLMKHLSFQDLDNCSQVLQDWDRFISNEKSYWMKRLKNHLIMPLTNWISSNQVWYDVITNLAFDKPCMNKTDLIDTVLILDEIDVNSHFCPIMQLAFRKECAEITFAKIKKLYISNVCAACCMIFSYKT